MKAVPRGSQVPSTRRLPMFLLSLPVLVGLALGAEPDPAKAPDPAVAVDLAMAAAETSLQKGDLPAAETQYREALFEGWLLVGMLDKLERRMPEAREAVENAALFSVETVFGLQALAGARLEMGDPAHAVAILDDLAAKNPRDGETRRLLARALAANGQKDLAAQRLGEAGALAGDDPQLAFLVGTDFLWMKRVEAASPFFVQLGKAKPIPQTHVLVGRAYRDAGEYDLARKELLAALHMDGTVRRAHYYLGMVLLADPRTGPDRLEKAIAEFREELKAAPDDGPTQEQLGRALLEAGRPEEAVVALEAAVRAKPRALNLFHLGRCQLALAKPAEAATSLRRALELAQEHAGSDAEIGKIHYQLGLALRKLGNADEAARHLGEAGRLAAEAGGGADEHGASSADADSSPLAELQLWERQGLKTRVEKALVRAYFNLGVLQAQGPTPRASALPAIERFTKAAAFFERAAALDAAFPQVQSSLGVAYFNAREFDKATGPLQRALEASPGNAGLQRMLATAWLNTGNWEKAMDLLAKDEQRKTDPALQLAYGLALLRSGRAPQAAEVLTSVLAVQADSAELRTLLGQAYEQMGKKELAQEQFERARQLKDGR
jgi:tetratricopeptide (TPR) repeat protein